MTLRIARAAGLAALPLLLLAGCTSTEVISRAPGRVRTVPARTAPVVVPTPAQRISQPKYGATVVVEKGNTVYHLATTNGITPLDLALWNDIPPPYIIHPGQRLRLYPSNARTPPPPPVQRPVASVPSATRPAPVSAPPTNGNLAWRWPTDGQVLSTYLAGEPTRQGLDIGGTSGQPVRAASDGVVVYSGAGLVGYGELVIIKHSNEWLTAYGHNRKRLVTEGQKVVAGQQIAEMGRTAAPRDMLHFEIRYDGKPVDPMQYLPAK